MKRMISLVALSIMFLGFNLSLQANEAHEHGAAHLSEIQWGLQGAQEAINIHPLFVHFPIALLLSAVAFYLAGLIFKRENFYISGKWTLILGALSSALTVWTGLAAEETVPHGGETHQIMMMHQYLGIGILVLSLFLAVWVILSKANIPSKGRAFFVIGLIVLAITLVQQGDFGGRMVFSHGVGVKAGGEKQGEAVGHAHEEAGHAH